MESQLSLPSCMYPLLVGSYFITLLSWKPECTITHLVIEYFSVLVLEYLTEFLEGEKRNKILLKFSEIKKVTTKIELQRSD